MGNLLAGFSRSLVLNAETLRLEGQRYAVLCRILTKLQISALVVRALFRTFSKIDVDKRGYIQEEEVVRICGLESTRFYLMSLRLLNTSMSKYSEKMDFVDFFCGIYNFCTYTRRDTLQAMFKQFADPDMPFTMMTDALEPLVKHVQGGTLTYNNKRIVRDYATAMQRSGTGVITFQSFEEMDKKHQMLLKPVFRLQIALHNNVVGARFWQTHINKRVEATLNYADIMRAIASQEPRPTFRDDPPSLRDSLTEESQSNSQAAYDDLNPLILDRSAGRNRAVLKSQQKKKAQPGAIEKKSPNPKFVNNGFNTFTGERVDDLILPTSFSSSNHGSRQQTPNRGDISPTYSLSGHSCSSQHQASVSSTGTRIQNNNMGNKNSTVSASPQKKQQLQTHSNIINKKMKASHQQRDAHKNKKNASLVVPTTTS